MVLRSTYSQVRMAQENEKYTTFRIPQGVFKYVVMPFGLINNRATFQRYLSAI
jgi:hypothetical protein